MTFTTKAVPVAMLLALAIPTFVHAAPKADLSATMPNLVIEAGNQQSSTSLAIHSLGGADAGAFHVKLELAGVTYEVALAGLQAGGIIPVQIPGQRDGKPFNVKITVDCDAQVAESDEGDNSAQFAYLQ